MASWESWPKEQQEMITTHPALNAEEEEAAKYEIWLQKTLYGQWQALKTYANQNGIRLVGDVPFYVGFDSCDVWANQESFLLDPETRKPLWIAGVPPDYFSKTGQRWGNPIYDWNLLEKRHFAFIINRLKLNGELYDVIRLDHFRAFDTYWKIPASCPTAIEGAWIEAPGYKLFDRFFQEVPGLEIIAEDLGDLRPEVLTLRDHYNFPGMTNFTANVRRFGRNLKMNNYYLFAAIVFSAILLIVLVLYFPRLKAWFGFLLPYEHLHNDENNRLCVLVPARNESEVIGPLLDSLSRQSYQDFEVYVIVKNPHELFLLFVKIIAQRRGASLRKYLVLDTR